MRTSSRIIGVAILIAAGLALVVWVAVWQRERAGTLTVSFLDVGQGDAIYIESPTGAQVLIDGGTGTAVLRALDDMLPIFDRSIDVLVGTHPDQDHIGGLIDVLERFRIGMVVQSSVVGDTPAAAAFAAAAAAEGTQQRIAVRGQVIDIGGGAQIEILFPDRAVPHIETNVGCIVARVVYGTTAFMLPCDAPDEIEKYLVQLGGTNLKSNVLKAAHHGSKTSSAPLFVGYVDPEYVVFSRGCENSYGHPHPDVVATYQRFNIPTLDTCTDGTITFVSDGTSVTRK